MKKIVIASLLFAASSLVAPAQTEFRHISFDEALAAAKQEKKLVFIDFFTTWCGPCRMMANKVFPEKLVGDYMNANFIPLKLDAEKEGLELSKRFGVKAYPTFVLIDAEGKEVGKVTGMMDGPVFIEKLKAALDPEQNPARIKARYESGERTPKVVNNYAMALLQSRKEDEGFKVINDYYDSLSVADRLKEENAFLFKVYTVDLESDRARFMQEHLNEFPEAVRKDVLTVLGSLYNQELSTYFSGYMYREGKYDPAKFADLKSKIAKYNLDKDGTTGIIYDFVEKRASSTDPEYLEYCERRFNELSPRSRDVLIMNMARLFSVDTPEMKESVAKFLRSHLSNLSPVAIQFAGRTLGTLEEK